MTGKTLGAIGIFILPRMKIRRQGRCPPGPLALKLILDGWPCLAGAQQLRSLGDLRKNGTLQKYCRYQPSTRLASIPAEKNHPAECSLPQGMQVLRPCPGASVQEASYRQVTARRWPQRASGQPVVICALWPSSRAGPYPDIPR
ncbi:hypothetical protein D3C71_1603040 [compost metagenome]